MTKEVSDWLRGLNEFNLENLSTSTLLDDINRIKKQAVVNKDETLANLFWCFEQAFGLKNLYLSAWKAIELKDYLQAWRSLIEAENLYPSLRKHSPRELAEYLNIEKINQLVEYMIRLYPFWHTDNIGVFTSNEEIHKSWQCSICNTPYKLKPKCKHIKGELYMGEICLKVITEVELKAIAMVSKPFDKNCVTISMNGKHFNELFNFVRLDGLIEMAHPLQYWTITSIEMIDEDGHQREHIQIGLSKYDIYGKPINNMKIKNETRKK